MFIIIKEEQSYCGCCNAPGSLTVMEVFGPYETEEKAEEVKKLLENKKEKYNIYFSVMSLSK